MSADWREDMNEKALDETVGGCSPSYVDCLTILLDRTEGEFDSEYARGQLEMVADAWAIEGVETGVRMDQIMADARKVNEHQRHAREVERMLLEPDPVTMKYTVLVTVAEPRHADIIMGERLGPDEDYSEAGVGDYQISYDEGEMVLDEVD